jgi:poly(3-hydroxybutyrate) depolymerase
LITFDQTAYLETGYTVETSSLNKEGYVYTPFACQDGNTTNCRVHAVFHGCDQTVDDIGESFLLMTGYNRWAAANNIIILYPQITKTTLNPNGCFDWWGYTGPDYASKLGVQMNAINGMINTIDDIIF